MCARTALARGKRVLLTDKSAAGRKLAICGGGKANVTNLHVDVSQYFGEQPDFCAPALAAWTPQDTLEALRQWRITWEERDHGQIFCRQSAKRLVEALTNDCAPAHMFLHEGIHHVERTPQGFVVRLEGRTLRAPALVLATGSPAWPQIGATDTGLRFAALFGHNHRPFRPVLAPLRMPPSWPLHGLTGISLPVHITAGGRTFADDLLFTHDGISGPAALQASCRWSPGELLYIDFLPRISFDALLDAPECGKLLPVTLLARHMPRRLAEALLPQSTARRKIAELSRAARTTIAAAVHRHSIVPLGTEGLTKAEAAAGGVLTDALDPHTLHSRITPGLHMVGELLDITGQLGGYNLHWAFASGRAAGMAV